MKRNLCSVLAISMLFMFNVSFAQSGIVSAGGNAKSETGSVSYSLGQVFTANASNTDGSVQQGIQQGYGITDETPDSVKNETNLDVSLQVKVYPNPTANDLVLKIGNYEAQKWEFSVFDMNGRRLLRGPITSGETVIPMSSFGNAVYFVRLLDGGKLLRTFKVVKQQ